MISARCLVALSAGVWLFLGCCALAESGESGGAKEARVAPAHPAPDQIAGWNHDAHEAFKARRYGDAQGLLDKVIGALEKEKDSQLSLAIALTNKSLVLKSLGETAAAASVSRQAEAIAARFRLPQWLKQEFSELMPVPEEREILDRMFNEVCQIIDGHDPKFPPNKIESQNSESDWRALSNQGQQLKAMGRFMEANFLLRKALAIANTFPSPNDKVITSLNALAGVYRHTGRVQAALMLYRAALKMDEQMENAETAKYATLLDNAAQCYQTSGDLEEARKMQERAIAIYKKTLGPDSYDAALTMSNLANVYMQQKQLPRAEQLTNEALTMLKKSARKGDPQILVTQDNLAVIYARQGKLVEAENLQRSVVSSLEKTYGKVHPDLAIAMENLARTLVDQKKNDEAGTLLGQALEMRKQIFGTNHPATVEARMDYVEFLKRTGRTGEAEKVLKEASSE